MKIYNNQQEIEKDIKDGILKIKGDVRFDCSFSVDASIIVEGGNINAGNINASDINARHINASDINAGNINAWNINAGNIDAWNINAGNINASDINARHIDAGHINAGNINAGNIDAWDIDAGNINAGNINASDINAGNILYYAICVSYNSIKCESIEARRENYQEPICLDGKLKIKDKKDGEVEIKVEGKTVKISRKSAKALNLID